MEKTYYKWHEIKHLLIVAIGAHMLVCLVALVLGAMGSN